MAKLRGDAVYVQPNPGNAGDALIAKATHDLFDRTGIEYRLFGPDVDLARSTLVYPGGGNLVPLYSDAADFIGRHHRAARRLIVLPHTIDGNESLLADLGPNVDLLCREERSFAHARRVARRANVLLVEDLALTLDAQAIVRSPRPAPKGADQPRVLERDARRLARQASRRRILATVRRAFGATGGDRVAYCIRTDGERSGRTAPFGNLDLSLAAPFEVAMTSRSAVELAAWSFLRYLDGFDRIVTDRLHVAIGAALLGKRVDLHAGSYWKNLAVYESTLGHRFPHVRWCDGAA